MKAIKTIAAAGLLLGATSVMAQPYNGTDYATDGSGNFTFILGESFDVECDDNDATIDASESGTHETSDMMVSSAGDLVNATAEIRCKIKAIRGGNWTLYLSAEHGGKMLKNGTGGSDPEVFLQLDDDDGRLGMWVEFTQRLGTGTANLGTFEAKSVYTSITPNLIEDGGVVSGHGQAIDPEDYTEANYKEGINLATVLDGSADRFRSFKTGDPVTGASIEVELTIRAAFVTSTADISSDKGTYVETITITAMSSPI